MRLEASGSVLEYFERGEGPPVVLLHGTGESSAQWDALMHALAPDHRVVAANLYGYGGSSAWDGRAAFRLRHECALIAELLRKLQAPAHLVGHSYGGSVALCVARSAAPHIRSLALFEPASFHLLRTDDPADGKALQDVVQVAVTVWEALVTGEYVMGAQFFVDYWSGCGAWARLSYARRDALVARLAKVGLDLQATIREQAGIDAFRELAMPRLILEGQNTTQAALRICRALAHAWPDARHRVIAGAGHMGPLTHAGEVNRVIAAFLRESARAP